MIYLNERTRGELSWAVSSSGGRGGWHQREYRQKNDDWLKILKILYKVIWKDTLISFYKNQVYKNIRLKILKNLRIC